MMSLDIFEKEMDAGLGNGPLCLGIFCTICNAHYEMNSHAISMAITMETTFLEYLRFVQNGKCPDCESKKEKLENN